MTYVRTYAQDVQARAHGSTSSITLTMCEIVDRAAWKSTGVRGVCEVSIEHIRVDSQGYGSDGRYVGRGAPVYDLYFEVTDGKPWSHTVRHHNRVCLRADLKRIFPNAKVSR